MKALRFLAVAAAALLLTGCFEDTGQKQGVGTILGAGIGGLAGAQVGKGRGQVVAAATGAVLGALLGSEIGKSLDRADRAAMQNTMQRSLESAPMGQPSQWRNPDSGNFGTVTPVNTYQRADGSYCREFSQTVTVGGKTQEAYGTACRQADGSWKIVSG
jgi:surface antigen